MIHLLYYEAQRPPVVAERPSLKRSHGLSMKTNRRNSKGRKQPVNLAGQKFTRLTPICLEWRKSADGRRRRIWKCRCDCGGIVHVSAHQLTVGNTKSCGCLKRESASQRFTKHGSHYHTEYGPWVHMKNRCNNPKHKNWKLYGGRGIKVCPQLQDDFQQFLKDVGPRPTMKHSLDRWPNKNGNYEPGNVRWATQFTQNNNARSNVLLTFNGKTLNFTGWARELGCHKDLIRQRIRLHGMSVKQALTKPIPKKKNK